MAENSRTGDWGWTPADGYYASFESFEPPQPRLADDLPGAGPSALALLIWLVLTMGALAASTRILKRRARG